VLWQWSESRRVRNSFYCHLFSATLGTAPTLDPSSTIIQTLANGRPKLTRKVPLSEKGARLMQFAGFGNRLASTERK
jgi:hypothetical protein